jgi:hypothetical protein
MTKGIDQKVVAISGASSGIGEATARLLGQSRAKVVLGARRIERLEKIVGQIKAAGEEAAACALDVTQRASAKSFVDSVTGAFGRLDVFTNNAGVMSVAPLGELKIDEWDQMIDPVCWRWRKLRLAVDADTQEITAVELTPDDVGDVSALPDLMDRIESPIGSVTADGAHDGDTVYNEVLQRHPAARVIIPPRSTAVLSDAGTTQRDDHLRSIETHGRIEWQCHSGYDRRSLVETVMYRYKTIIGRRLHARTLLNQRTEGKIACNALNKMTRLSMPVSVRIK